MIKRLLFFFAVLLSTPALAQIQIGGDSLSVDYGRPKDFEIGGVTVSGTQFLDPGVLINISGLTIGDTIAVPGDDISNAIRNLWKQGLFSEVPIQIGIPVGVLSTG